jgi:glycosyltransferase involved in cell wall biosynthesis
MDRDHLRNQENSSRPSIRSRSFYFDAQAGRWNLPNPMAAIGTKYARLMAKDRATALSQRKLLFLTRTFEYGGAEKHLIDVLNHLHQSGLRISIVCFQTDEYSARVTGDLGITVTSAPLPPNSLLAWFSFFRQIRPDVVVFVYGWSWCFHWIAPIGAWLAGISKRYAIQHLVVPAGKRSPLAQQMRKLLRHANLKLSAFLLNKTICVSDAVRNSLVGDFGFPRKKLITIRNGVSPVIFAPSMEDGLRLRRERGIGPDEFVLICVARLSKQKDVDILLHAIAKVRRDGIQCKCMILGDGPLRSELTDLAQHLDLNGTVFFEGFQEEVRPYLQAGSAFILTSHNEGLPLAILEAAACGLPCIVTDVGGNTEIVTHRVNGLVVRPGSVGEVADAISFLATHPDERQQMSGRARRKIQDDFDIEKSMSEIKGIISR